MAEIETTDVVDVKLDPEFEALLMEEAIDKAVPVLYSVAKELRKRPVLAETLAATATDLDGLSLAFPWARKQLDAGREEVDVVADIVGINQPTKRFGRFGPSGEAKIAEIVAERKRIWARLDELSGTESTDEERAEFETLMEASSALNELTLRAISNGEVDPMTAALAASGSEAF